MEASATVEEPTLSKRAETILKLTLAILPPLLLIALLEGAAFIWERGQANGLYAWELVASRRIDLIPQEGAAGGYTLMKPGAVYRWQGIPVEINSSGLRGPEFEREKPVGTFRILNLGDSIAMGWGVRYEDTYGARLVPLLEGQGTGGQSIEVINAGVPGWNPENYLAYMRSEGTDLDPDVVLLDFTLVNDVYGPNALDKSERPALIEWLRTRTHFWPFLSVQFRTLQARADGRERIDVIDPPTRATSYFPVNPDDPRWDQVWSRITSIEQTAREGGAAFLLVVFPMEYQVLDDGYSTLPQEIFNTRARSEGIDLLDLLPAFRDECEAKPDGPCALEDRYLYADVWMHPSARGHAITASEIAQVLQQTESLP